MVAKVKEIQVCGGHITHDLKDACASYLEVLEEGTDRKKLSFTIILPDGSVKSITIRQEGEDFNNLVAYGDFEDLPNALDYAKEVEGVTIFGGWHFCCGSVSSPHKQEVVTNGTHCVVCGRA